MDTRQRIERIQQTLERLDNRYNPEWDFTPNQPTVTYTDACILDTIRDLLSIIEDLQRQIKELK